MQTYYTAYTAIVRSYYDAIEHLARFLAPAVTVCAIAYALYKSWRHSERRLPDRLREFFARDEKRLRDVRVNLLSVIEKSGTGTQVGAPIFVDRTLSKALSALRWPKRIRRAGDGLEKSLTEIELQLALLEKQRVHFEKQRAAAHLLRGAIWAASAAKSKAIGRDGRDEDLKALGHFADALAIDEADTEALEFAGHQRVRLGEYAAALADFERLEWIGRFQGRPVVQAKAMRFQAEILAHQYNAASKTRARDLLRDALNVLPIDAPLLIKAEIYEALGVLQERRAKLRAAAQSYNAAERIYKEIRNVEGANGASRVRDAAHRIGLRPIGVSEADDDIVLSNEVLPNGSGHSTQLTVGPPG